MKEKRKSYDQLKQELESRQYDCGVWERRAKRCEDLLETEIKSFKSIKAQLDEALKPVPLILTCPACGERHIDDGVYATRVHHNHCCQYCGLVWRPAVIPTIGVQFLPGFKR